MSADVVQGNYEQLQQVATRFQSQSEQIAQMEAQLRRSMQKVEGTWEGRGSDAFHREMNSLMMPGVVRLKNALNQANTITAKIANTLKQAEEEAAGLFRGNGSGGTPGGDPGGGSAGGTPGGATDPGSGGPTGGGGTGGGQSSEPKGILDYLKSKVTIFGGDQGEKGKFTPELGFKLGAEGALWGDPSKNGFSAGGGEGGIGFGLNDKGGYIGAYVEGYAVQGKLEGTYLGDKQFGGTAGISGKLLSGEGFIGYKDGQLGAKIGGSLASAQGDLGVNVAGYNVGVTGEIGLKAEAGFEFGKKGVKISLPLFSIGISFGKAKD
jgi:WXG100 family type VII secretion target